MLAIVRSFLNPGRDSTYDHARSFTRARRYVEWRRHAQHALHQDISIGDRPSLLAVLIDAWRYRSAQGRRAAKLEAAMRSLLSDWLWKANLSEHPEAKMDRCGALDFRAGYEAAVKDMQEEVQGRLAVDL